MRNAIFACTLKRQISRILFTKADERNTEGLTANVDAVASFADN